jgi:hypothetical protein
MTFYETINNDGFYKKVVTPVETGVQLHDNQRNLPDSGA